MYKTYSVVIYVFHKVDTNTNTEYEILDEVIVICVNATAFIPILFIQLISMLLNTTFCNNFTEQF